MQLPCGSLDPCLWSSTSGQSAYPFLAAGPDGSLDRKQAHTTQQREAMFGSGKVKFFITLLESRDVNLLPERPPTSLCRQAKRLEWGSAQQAGPPQCSHSSAVLGEGKDAGVPLMLYKTGAGNSRRPSQVPTASLCAWDPSHGTGHTLAQAGQPKNLRGWATPVIHIFETDGGKKGKRREGVGVGRKQTPDTTF